MTGYWSRTARSVINGEQHIVALPNNSAKTIVSFVIMLFDMSELLVFSFPKTLFSILLLYSIACPTLSNSYFLLHYCIYLYSPSSIWLHVFFLFFFFSLHPVCFVLTKGPKLLTSTCPSNTSAYSVHELWAFDYYFCFYIYANNS